VYRLGVSRNFEARHYLIGGDWGAENIEHSHHYRLELILEADKLDNHGFLVDIVEVERHLDEVVAEFSSKILNKLTCLNNRNPSIEEFATALHGIFTRRLEPFLLETITVTLWEDDIAWTSYRPAV
jgi:6-pyruvoyltetrahydropterin/6-carboxytetrahydropterin synthase